MNARAVVVSVASLSAVFLGVAGAPQSTKKPEALVVGIVGDWTQAGSDHPEKGTPVHFLSTLAAGEGACVYGSGGYLAVQLEDRVISFPCEVASEGGCDKTRGPSHAGQPYACARHIVRPPELSRLQSIKASFFAAIMPLMRRDAERYVVPVSRGMDPELRDAVVPLRGTTVDFAPAFGDLENGSYALQLAPVDGPSYSTIKVNVNWKEGGAATVMVPGLREGLYRVTRLSDRTPTGQDAWVLVSPADQFEKRSANYQNAVEATRHWPNEVDARAPQAVLRAYLQALSNAAQ